MSMACEASGLTEDELIKRNQRKQSYHLVASNNRLPHDDDETDYLFQYLVSIRGQSIPIKEAKSRLLRELGQTEGDTTTPEFQAALEDLLAIADNSFDVRKKPEVKKKNKSFRSMRQKQEIAFEGMWIDLAKPHFANCLGKNHDNEPIYTLGRMSFGVYQPSNLLCSIKGTFNPVRLIRSKDKEAAIESFPESYKMQLQSGNNVLRSYNTVTPFTIEPNSPDYEIDSPNHDVDKPIEGLMTTFGYVVPSEEEPQKLTVCFTGGCIEVADLADLPRWRQVLDQNKYKKNEPQSKSPPKRTWFKRKKAEATSAATPPETLEMEVDGKLSFQLNGNVVASVDMVYLDETLRIARSSTGVVYVFARVEHFPDE